MSRYGVQTDQPVSRLRCQHGSRTAPDLDRDFDPFGVDMACDAATEVAMWISSDLLREELGLLGGRIARTLSLRGGLSAVVGRTSVSRNDPQGFEVVFDYPADAVSTGLLLSICGAPQATWALPPDDRPIDASATAKESHLESSLADIQSWLGISLQQAAEAAGISRGTVYAWRERGSVPRPGTVQGVLRIHGLVASAVRTAGLEEARSWFHTGDPSPLDQLLSARGDDALIRRVSKQLRRDLTSASLPPIDPWMAANQVDLSE